MSLLLTNPYRILGLQATASRREMTKRIDDLLARVEIGKFKHYPLDCANQYSLIRNQESINHAIHQLESEENKLFFSLFWFISFDSVDELALECLENGQYDKASDFWQKQIEKTDSPKFSWLINHSTLLLLKSLDSALPNNYIAKAMQLLGQVLSTQLSNIKEAINITSEIDERKLIFKITDHVREFIDQQSSKIGMKRVNLQDTFKYFPMEALQHLISKEISFPLQKIENSIEYSELKRKEKNKIEIYHCNALLSCEKEVENLKPYTENYRVKSTLNAYADEILDCAIFANNQLEDTALAVRLVEHAVRMPSWDATRLRIEENKTILDNNLLHENSQQEYKKIINFAQSTTSSLAHARIKINVIKDDLDKIKHESVEFTTASSICANVMLDYLVDIFNQEFQLFEKNTKPDPVKLKKFLSIALDIKELTASLKKFILNRDTRDRIDKNLATVSNVSNQLNEVYQKMGSRGKPEKSSNETLKTLIGWGIFIFIIISILKK